ncbi:MAG: hypothetical protein MUF38_02780 [Anaerolineae bacterium]|jgi:MFS family permease|nr:hypothetical protein [Anaerolineae bacterium]
MTDATEMQDETTYCAVHPDRETGLRCNKCGRYMCAACAVSTPVGYRCRECVRQVDDKFFTGTNTDNIVIAAVCALATGAVGFLGAITGFGYVFLVGIFGGVIAGGAIAALAFRAVERRRGRYSPIIGAASALGGGVLGALLGGYRFGGSIGGFGVLLLVGIIAVLVYRRFEYK